MLAVRGGTKEMLGDIIQLVVELVAAEVAVDIPKLLDPGAELTCTKVALTPLVGLVAAHAPHCHAAHHLPGWVNKLKPMPKLKDVCAHFWWSLCLPNRSLKTSA